MENAVKLFESAEFGKVRVMLRDGESWFVARDVAQALGYADVVDAVSRHCKYAELLKGGETPPLDISENVGPRGLKIIPEADVYALIFRSKLPKAQEFQDWVFREVLPSIRRTGRYGKSTFDMSFIQQIVESACRAAVSAAWQEQQPATSRKARARKADWEEKVASYLDHVDDPFGDFEEMEDIEYDLRGVDLNTDSYCRVRDIPWLRSVFIPSKDVFITLGKHLGILSKKCNCPVLTERNERYGSQMRFYHPDVINMFRKYLDTHPEFMARHRRGKK